MTFHVLTIAVCIAVGFVGAPSTRPSAASQNASSTTHSYKRMPDGKQAYVALVAGGPSGFDAVYGGGRNTSGEYARLEAHGFYWTASESSPTKAWLYNLGKNGQILNRHEDGEKQQAFAVRCVRE